MKRFLPQPLLLVGLVILLWAPTPAVAKLLLADLTSIQVLAYASLLATLALLLIIVATSKVKTLSTYAPRDFLSLPVLGSLDVLLYYLFLYGALTFIPAQEASIVNYLWPLLVGILGSILLREKLRIHHVLALLLSFSGVYVVINRGTLTLFSDWRGVLLAILGACSYALYSVLSKRWKYTDVRAIFYGYAWASLICIAWVVLHGTLYYPSPYQLIGLIWMGTMPSALAYIVWLSALRQAPARKMAKLVYLPPLVSLIFIYTILGEKILISSFLGLLLIVAGIVIQLARK